jgi:hypothetical protein
MRFMKAEAPLWFIRKMEFTNVSARRRPGDEIEPSGHDT